MLLTDKVGDWLERLLLTHDEPDAFGLLVAHKLAIAYASLLPLFLTQSVELDTQLEDALKIFSAAFNLDCW